MSAAWVDDNAGVPPFRWWHDHGFVSQEARAARRLDEAARLCELAARNMAEAGRSDAFGLSADLRKQADQLRALAETCVAELNEGGQ